MKKNLSLGIATAAAFLLLGAGFSPFGSDTPTSTGPAGVFVSTDKAESWKQISIFTGPTGAKSLSAVSVYKLINDSQAPNTLYWASRGNGMFYSYDMGKTWQLSPDPLSTGFIYGMAINPKDKCILYATNGTKVFESTDCNRSWSEIYREPANDRIVNVSTDPFAPERVYILKAGGDLLVSNDTGISRQLLKRFSTDVLSFQVDTYQEGVLYVATAQNGLFRSDDGGKNWTSSEKALKKFTRATEFRKFVVSPTKEGEVYWISTYGILVSNDRGNTWTPMNILNAPGTIKIYAFAINPKDDKEMYYTGTIENRSFFYKTIDGGINWITKKLPSDQVPTALLIHSEQDNVLYLGLTIPPKQ